MLTKLSLECGDPWGTTKLQVLPGGGGGGLPPAYVTAHGKQVALTVAWWHLSSALLLAICLGHRLNLSEPQFPPLWDGNNNSTYPTGCCKDLIKWPTKAFAQQLARSKHLANSQSYCISNSYEQRGWDVCSAEQIGDGHICLAHMIRWALGEGSGKQSCR